jgi:hypothetical protein
MLFNLARDGKLFLETSSGAAESKRNLFPHLGMLPGL